MNWQSRLEFQFRQNDNHSPNYHQSKEARLKKRSMDGSSRSFSRSARVKSQSEYVLIRVDRMPGQNRVRATVEYDTRTCRGVIIESAEIEETD